MSSRIIAGAIAVAAVFLALAAEPGGTKLDAQRTAVRVARSFGADATASCHGRSGWWDYDCRVRRPGAKQTFTVDVRVDSSTVIETNRP